MFDLTKQLIRLADAFKDILPLLGVLGGIKLFSLAKRTLPGVSAGLKGSSIPGFAGGGTVTGW